MGLISTSAGILCRLISRSPDAPLAWPPTEAREPEDSLPLRDEGSAARDGAHQALVGEHLDSPPHSHRGQPRLFNEVDDARDLPARRVLPCADPLPQDGGQLLERELRSIMIDLHMITLAGMIM